MKPGHTPEEIRALLDRVEVASVATSSGDSLRTRLMHFAADQDFNLYLATLKGDPKTLQITNKAAISLLVHESGQDIGEAKEAEITGRAALVRDPEEREKTLRLTAQRSPVVKHLRETGQAGALDCIKVTPERIKFRIFREIVQGVPPTVLEFPKNRAAVSEWALLKQKAFHWFLETRAPFLTASLVPILLGTAVAGAQSGNVHWGYFLLALLAGMCLHLGTNIINDYFDHKSGNDEINQEFVRPFCGGSRLIQLGLLTPLEVLTEALVFFLVGTLIGLYLAWNLGWPLLVLGGVALVSGFFYTGRPFNWASRGVGELAVGLNFGPLMALGAYYVQTQSFSWTPIVASLPVGFLIAAVLYINEFPDYTADKAVGKRTLVVRLGRERAPLLYGLIMLAVYLPIVLGVVAGGLPPVTLMALATVPLSVRAVQYAIQYHSRSFDLSPANAWTILGHLATGLLLVLAYLWEGVGAQGWVYLALGALGFAGFTAFMYLGVEKQKNLFFSMKQSLK